MEYEVENATFYSELTEPFYYCRFCYDVTTEHTHIVSMVRRSLVACGSPRFENAEKQEEKDERSLNVKVQLNLQKTINRITASAFPSEFQCSIFFYLNPPTYSLTAV